MCEVYLDERVSTGVDTLEMDASFVLKIELAL